MSPQTFVEEKSLAASRQQPPSRSSRQRDVLGQQAGVPGRLNKSLVMAMIF